MLALERVTLHEYHGKLGSNGRSGRLQVLEIRENDTLAQPFATPTESADAILNSGHTVPCVGLGTWKSETGQVNHAVYEALKAGYRHLDCAAIYENEHEVGAALQRAFAERVTTRDNVFVTSKLWYVLSICETLHCA